MNDKKRKCDEPAGGAGSGRGRPAHPSSEPDAPERDDDEPVKEIPIGMPMDPEEFRRRKEEAERPQSEDESDEKDSKQEDELDERDSNQKEH